MLLEADEAELVEQHGGDERGAKAGSGEESGAEFLGDGEADDCRDDADGSPQPGPPGDAADAVGWDCLADEELDEQEGGQTGGVDRKRGPERLAELFVELGVEAGLEGIGDTGRERYEKKQEGHGLDLQARTVDASALTRWTELRGGSGNAAELSAEEGGDRAEDAQLGRRGKPVAFAGEEELLVGDAECGEPRLERMGEGDGDDGVGVAVNDEGGREAGSGLGIVRGDEAAGDVDEGADAGAGFSAEGEREKGAERDADEGDAAGVDVGLGADVGEGVADRGEPEWDVNAVGEHGGRGSVGSSAVEVVDGEDEDAEPGEHGRDAVEPEADVAAGAVQQDDGGVRAGGGGPGDVEADGFAAAEEGFHGWF